MKTITLERTWPDVVETIVDDEDYEELSKFRWYLDGKGYVRQRNSPALRLHQHLLPPQPGLQVDHTNQNKLDNRRQNLRYVNLNQQARNVGPRKNNSSGHKGVGWFPRYNKWRAYITFNKQPKTIGYYDTIEEAVKARATVETELFEQ